MSQFFLDQAALSEAEADAPGGGIRFTIFNFSGEDIDAVRFAYTGVMRPLAAPAGAVRVTGGCFVETLGSYTAIALDTQIKAGAQHEVTLRGMAYPATARARGAITAWLEDASGTTIVMDVGDVSPSKTHDATPAALPAGRIELPLGLLPWPRAVSVEDWWDRPHRYAPANDTTGKAMAQVAALHRRLFPTEPSPFQIKARHDTVAVVAAEDRGLDPGAFVLEFGSEVSLRHKDADGLRHGMVTLAQIGHAALIDPAFRQPKGGQINDAPRFDWRGCHLDVVRSFHGIETIKRLLDIMAWLKMNWFHWHGTEDEGWRFPSRAFQGLNALANDRRRDSDLRPQYGDGPEGSNVSYSAEQVAEIISYAADLGIQVMPEIEIPGHATALLNVVEGLRDPDEPPESYRSVQGFPNNALNPALPRSYEVVEALLRETAETFPGPVLHIGSDEVEQKAWRHSPAVRALAEAEGLSSAMELQAHFLRRVQKMVVGLGKTLAGWDECAEGGGIAPDDTILFAWRNKAKMAELIGRGYDVVATPGQAYYLDMMQRGGWDGYGIGWAGLADPESTYCYDPGADLPDGPGRLLGVQACIWTEYLPTTAHLNAMMFPRLGAIAEAGWTAQEARDWLSFCARRHLVPQL
ncbi:family 20 glycosylhydrolase [Gymnodinialimonas sp. 2305UL16-5]|uniref:beta-N-acetylhexosaminidase n=1 Tax=Gymnodinialimonas mytili TaxID=3126503 RepID=UPI00309C421C